MIDAIFNSPNYQVARQMMDATVLRHQALAANIANAETPGYKRVDVAPNFAMQLRAALERGGAAELRNVQAQIAEDLTSRSVRPDGNNVEIEKELLALGRNSTEFNFLAQIVSNDIRGLRVAITGRTNA
jgi:flagellar basal-body rod protein FlgB